MKKGLNLLITILLCMALVLSGCNSSSDTLNDNGSGNTDSGGNLKVALLLSGPANDQGWNASALEGLKAAEKDMGIEIAYMENVELVDSEAAYRDYASQGFDLIIGHGFQFGEPAVRVSKSFPDANFMATESSSQSENAASFVMSCEQGGYLMGIICSSMSKTGKIGVVGGFEQPSIVKEVEAFKVAAKSVNPDIEVLDVYISSFTDVTAGKAAASSMIDQGVDVLYHVANQAGTGVIKAAQEKGIFACGNSYDQHSIAPDTVICSTVYNMPEVILQAVNQVKEGKFGGGIYHLGMADNVVDIASYNAFEDKIPQDLKDLIEKLKGQITDGSLVVPLIEVPTK